MASILVVDDNPPMRRLLRNTLFLRYRVVEAATAVEAMASLRRNRPDLVLLELELPDMDGLDLIQKMRAQSQLPIVVLSSRGDEQDKVAALDSGADDYVSKPFGTDELMARIRTALRHRLQEQGSQPIFESGGLAVDLVHRRIMVGAREVKLSPKEYDILQQLVIHAGKVLTHRHLLREVWNSETTGNVQSLRVFVRQLRQKLEQDPERPQHILTQVGVGYRLSVRGSMRRVGAADGEAPRPLSHASGSRPCDAETIPLTQLLTESARFHRESLYALPQVVPRRGRA
jgi:two-component system KDP operon response regulator KdpE